MKKNNIQKIPYHLVLFPDGNRRWARKKGLSISKGYLEGYKNLINFAYWCQEKGVRILTAFGFSTENWKREKKEVAFLMNLLEKGLSEEKNIQDFQKKGVKVKIIGQKNRLPKSLQKVILKVEKLTKNNKKFYLNLAISYGGKWDIVQSLKEIVKRKVPLSKITEELVAKYLSTYPYPDPDLIIRAGGEKRLSNFLLWQGAYSELYFSDKLWPDFTKKDLEKALQEYQRRQRRFGR
jgi:undecaprenyl diphosphate synthase